MKLFFITVLSAFCISFFGKAQSVSWTGNGDGSTWHDSNNWSTSTVPTINDDVDIAVTAWTTVNINTSAQCKSLTLNSLRRYRSVTLNINNNSTLFEVAENITYTGSLLINFHQLSLNEGQLNLGGNFLGGNLFGTYLLYLQFNTGTTVNYNGTESQTILAWNYDNLTISENRLANDVTLQNGTINVTGDFSSTATFTTGGYINTGNTVNYSGSGSQTVASIDYNNLTISNNKNAGTITFQSGNLKVAGVFSNANNNVSNYVTTNNLFSYNGTAEQEVDHQFTYNDLEIDNAEGGTATSDITVNGDLHLTQGALGISDINLSLLGGLNIENGTFSTSFNTALYIEQGTNSADISLPSINLGLLEVNRSNSISLTGDLTVDNYIEISDGGTLNGGNNTISTTDITINGTLDAPTMLTINGSFLNNSTFIRNQGTVAFVGTSPQEIDLPSPTSFYNINISNTSGVTFSSNSAGADLYGILDLQGLGVFDADGVLNDKIFTLKSTSAGDAGIATIDGTAAFSGEVIIERFLTNNANMRAWRYLSSPIENSFVSDWKDDMPITGKFDDPSTPSEWPSIPGIVEKSPSMYEYNETVDHADKDYRWDAYPASGSQSSNSPLTAGKGYAAFSRSTAATVLEIEGNIRQGDIAIDLTAKSAGAEDGWNLLGNPYPCAISWNNISLPSTLTDAIYVRDNVNNGGTGTSNYVSYINGVGSPSSFDGQISSGQAFWVKTTADATFTFRESDKSTENPTFYRASTPSDVFRVSMTGNGNWDETVIRLDDEATDGYDKHFDAYKLKNSKLNLSSVAAFDNEEDEIELVINGLPTNFCERDLQLKTTGFKEGTYTINFDGFDTFSRDWNFTLVDNFDRSVHKISQGFSYTFIVDKNPATKDVNRFALLMGQPTITTDIEIEEGTICSHGEGKLTLTNTQAGVHYQILKDGEVIEGSISGTGDDQYYTLPENILTPGNHLFELQAFISECSEDPVSITSKQITIDPGVELLSISQVASVCSEGEVTLLAKGGENTVAYRWYEGDHETLISETISGQFITPTLDRDKTYYVSTVNASGCESSKTKAVAKISTIDPPTITQNDNILKSSSDKGNQWYKDGLLIAGATKSNYTVVESGKYTVVVSNSDCSASSSSIDVQQAETESAHSESPSLHAFPNPATAVLNVVYSHPNSENFQLTIYNPYGGQIFDQTVHQNSNDVFKTSVNIENLNKGVYIVKIQDGKDALVKSIIKQ